MRGIARRKRGEGGRECCPDTSTLMTRAHTFGFSERVEGLGVIRVWGLEFRV